ncbi:MAG: FecR domain-containing protein [Verrucomicrobiae bacterium]|nr:FecR domain-containing protein [Verrucomicrobiae bacterium]
MKNIQICLLSITLCAWGTTNAFADLNKFKAIAVEGDVRFGFAEKDAKQKVTPGMDLPPGAVIVTGADGNLILQQGTSFTVVQVKPKTLITLKKSEIAQSGETETMIRIEKGTMMGNVQKQKEGSKFEVETPLAVGAVRGTQIFVMVQDRGGSISKTVAGVYRSCKVLVFTKEGMVKWTPLPGVVIQGAFDIKSAADFPTEVVRALFDFKGAEDAAKGQALILIPSDSKDDILILQPNPFQSMEQFGDTIILLLGTGSNFPGGPPIGIFDKPPGQLIDTQSISNPPASPALP